MASRVLPLGTMVVGYLGAASSSVPVVAILTSRSLRRQPMFRAVSNLALCETWFLFCGGVLGTVNVVGARMTPQMCAVAQSHNLSVGLGSSAALLVLSVERYVAVVHGLRYQSLLAGRRLWLLLLAPWCVMGVAFFASLAASMMVAELGRAPLHCRFLEVMPPPLKLAATGTAMAISLVTIAVNSVISRVAVRHQQAISSQRQLVGLQTQESVSAYWGVLRVTIIYLIFQVSPATKSLPDRELDPAG